MKFYNALCLYYQNDSIEIRQAESYSYCQFIVGKDHTAYGRARPPFMTGSGRWRAVIGEDFTKANIQVLAKGLSDKMKNEGVAEQKMILLAARCEVETIHERNFRRRLQLPCAACKIMYLIITVILGLPRTVTLDGSVSLMIRPISASQ